MWGENALKSQMEHTLVSSIDWRSDEDPMVGFDTGSTTCKTSFETLCNLVSKPYLNATFSLYFQSVFLNWENPHPSNPSTIIDILQNVTASLHVITGQAATP